MTSLSSFSPIYSTPVQSSYTCKKGSRVKNPVLLSGIIIYFFSVDAKQFLLYESAVSAELRVADEALWAVICGLWHWFGSWIWMQQQVSTSSFATELLIDLPFSFLDFNPDIQPEPLFLSARNIIISLASLVNKSSFFSARSFAACQDHYLILHSSLK